MRRRRKRRRPKESPPELTVAQILAWADAHHERTGRWPNLNTGLIPGTLGERWKTVNRALTEGWRGLPGGSSLALLLAQRRGARTRRNIPPLTEEQILAWADAHRRRTGAWPIANSGPVHGQPGESWRNLHAALCEGLRGLRGGSSLARLLAARRGVPNQADLPRLTIAQILAWADDHHRRTGEWPQVRSGPITAAPRETWVGADHALRSGLRGLPGGSSLARLLADRRGVRNASGVGPLTVPQILAWADDHRRRTGQWPHHSSGPIAAAPGETWQAVQSALRDGGRGLPGGSSLPRLLAAERDVRNRMALPPLRLRQVLAWADAYHRRNGRRPTCASGPIPEAPGETWATVNDALELGRRGLPGGSSLSRLLQQHRRPASAQRS